VVVTTRSQVPLLGDLPFIGALFRGTNDTNQREEVIVMLTPHIITDAEQTGAEARADDIRRKRFGVKEEMQWTGRARLVEDRYANAAKYYLDGDSEAALQELKTVLELRPAYLEAIRLKERIIGETDPEAAAKIERNVLESVEQEDTSRWQRR
jgi:type IV pilus assembly protein PilQ